MKKKILICGGTGFIGRNIAEAVAKNKNYEVFATYNKTKPEKHDRIKMVRADLTHAKQVEKVVKGMDIVVQAAAVTSGAKEGVLKPHFHVTDNAVMNSLVFRSAHENQVKHVVFFSCSVMYQSSPIPLKESDFNPNDEIFPTYFGVGWTKVYLEKMCEFYSKIGDTKYTVLRHSNIYGPYDKFDLERSHVFGATITKVMMAKDKGSLVVWGSGDEERDLLYVSDLVRFVEISLKRQQSRYELVNVGYGSSISVRELVEKCIQCSGKEVKIKHDLTKPSIKTKLCLNIAKAKAVYGWSPDVSLEDGIRKTMDWYKSNIMSC